MSFYLFQKVFCHLKMSFYLLQKGVLSSKDVVLPFIKGVLSSKDAGFHVSTSFWISRDSVREPSKDAGTPQASPVPPPFSQNLLRYTRCLRPSSSKSGAVPRPPSGRTRQSFVIDLCQVLNFDPPHAATSDGDRDAASCAMINTRRQ